MKPLKELMAIPQAVEEARRSHVILACNFTRVTEVTILWGRELWDRAVRGEAKDMESVRIMAFPVREGEIEEAIRVVTEIKGSCDYLPDTKFYVDKTWIINLSTPPNDFLHIMTGNDRYLANIP